jgi:hypothetical protein
MMASACAANAPVSRIQKLVPMRLLLLLVPLISWTCAAEELASSDSFRLPSQNLRRGMIDGSAAAAGQQVFTLTDSMKRIRTEIHDDIAMTAGNLSNRQEDTRISAPATNRRLTSSFRSQWQQLDPHERLFAVLGTILAFLFCWCLMSCICNCLRACCCGAGRPQRHEYRQIDSMGRTVVYRDSYYHGGGGASRPCMNLLWGACCFECCCRDNQDVDCCQLCCPLLLMEWCCPPWEWTTIVYSVPAPSGEDAFHQGRPFLCVVYCSMLLYKVSNLNKFNREEKSDQ